LVIETIIAVIIVTMASILTIILAILINSIGYNETNNKKLLFLVIIVYQNAGPYFTV